MVFCVWLCVCLQGEDSISEPTLVLRGQGKYLQESDGISLRDGTDHENVRVFYMVPKAGDNNAKGSCNQKSELSFYCLNVRTSRCERRPPW